MNILVLNYEYPPIGGGASPVSKELSESYVKKGHNVTVVTMAYKNLPKEEIINGVKIVRVRCFRSKKNVCHPWEQMSYIISAYNYLRHRRNKNKFDCIHTHFIIPTGVVGLWYSKKSGTQNIITAHGSDVIGHNNKRFKFLYAILKQPWRYIVSNSNCVVAPSNYLIDLMKKTENRANYFMIPNGVDTSVFVPMEKKRRIIVLCRLQETKGVQIVLEALAKIKSSLKGWRVDILGEGPYEHFLKSLAKENCLEDIVYFRGWIENKSEEHLKYIGQADIYISASRVENCPVSVLEAMSGGCRLILSDIPAHRQLCNNKDSFFRVDNIDELSDKILQMVIDKEKNKVPEKVMDWDAVAEQYLKLMSIS